MCESASEFDVKTHVVWQLTCGLSTEGTARTKQFDGKKCKRNGSLGNTEAILNKFQHFPFIFPKLPI